jgi:hypothetical protein
LSIFFDGNYGAVVIAKQFSNNCVNEYVFNCVVLFNLFLFNKLNIFPVTSHFPLYTLLLVPSYVVWYCTVQNLLDLPMPFDNFLLDLDALKYTLSPTYDKIISSPILYGVHVIQSSIDVSKDIGGAFLSAYIVIHTPFSIHVKQIY